MQIEGIAIGGKWEYGFIAADRMDTIQTRDKPIEITAEMIEAGVREYYSFDRDADPADEIVVSIYQAMHDKALNKC